MRGASEGSASVMVLVLLVLLAAAAGGAALVIDGSILQQRRSEAAYAQRRLLQGEADRVVAALAADPTPKADSPLDPVWSLVDAPDGEGVTLRLEDVSSALDPNWVQKNVFSKTALKSMLADEGAADVLQQRREDQGFFTNLADAYGDLFAAGALDKHFTAYAYANVNVTDEFALQKLYALRTGDTAAAEVFHTKVQQLLGEQRILKPEELQTFLGSAYDALYPIMNVEPCMNVHYIDPTTLSALLAYPDLKVPHPQEAAQALLDTRERSELSAADLERIIGAPRESRIYQYLGVVTWFWRITAAKGASHLDLVVARVPGPTETSVQYTIVEERFGRS